MSLDGVKAGIRKANIKKRRNYFRHIFQYIVWLYSTSLTSFYFEYDVFMKRLKPKLLVTLSQTIMRSKSTTIQCAGKYDGNNSFSFLYLLF